LTPLWSIESKNISILAFSSSVNSTYSDVSKNIEIAEVSKVASDFLLDAPGVEAAPAAFPASLLWAPPAPATAAASSSSWTILGSS